MKKTNLTKRQKILIALLVIAFAGVSAGLGFGISYGVYSNADYGNDIAITAHSGCEGTQTNSIGSFRAGIEAGADCVEMDVRFRADGTAVLHHNSAGEATLTLREAFEFLDDYYCSMNLDLKEYSDISDVVELIAEFDFYDRAFFSGVGQDNFEDVRAQAPNISIYLNVSELAWAPSGYEKIAADALRLDAVGVNLNYILVSSAAVKYFHSKGLLVSVWTVDTSYSVCRAAAFGVDNITTRKPVMAAEILR